MSRAKNTVKSAGKTAAAKPEKAVSGKKLQQLQENEAIISKAQSSFLDSGKALKAIRDQKLFKASGHENFETYCKQKWGYSQNYSNRLIAAYNCYEVLKKALAPSGRVLPGNEYQYRALAGLKESQWVKAWKQVLSEAAGEPVTGEMVEQVVRKLGGAPRKKGKQYRLGKPSTAKPPEAKKLVKIGKLVKSALKNKTVQTAAKLLKLLKQIQKLAAE